MKLLRLSAILAMCFAFVVLAASASADDKAVDKDKSVGTWELVKSGGKRVRETILVQFTKDGKVQIRREMTFQIVEGTYKIEGNKLTLVKKSRGPEDKITRTIKTLTDKKLVWVDDKGTEEEFVKTK